MKLMTSTHTNHTAQRKRQRYDSFDSVAQLGKSGNGNTATHHCVQRLSQRVRKNSALSSPETIT